ncbi:MAG TPA: hypothetical protein VK735_39930 [Pseudonocardia sp.]|uniref:hypothetical protein n=1 Tax=Pseudonocardia sp. TaxID=60912 RepID=UPI002BA6FD3F|nr:hypothetical protein [Pseudonocardia sp.]HTF53654.1 hypothetical protein [Pseudonocardia sp.]
MTATIERSDVDLDLEAWLDHEIEIGCEVLEPYSDNACGRPSNWLLIGDCGTAGHTSQAFACDPCKGIFTQHHMVCSQCNCFAAPRLVERVREGR